MHEAYRGAYCNTKQKEASAVSVTLDWHSPEAQRSCLCWWHKPRMQLKGVAKSTTTTSTITRIFNARFSRIIRDAICGAFTAAICHTAAVAANRTRFAGCILAARYKAVAIFI
jgi:hypothetical protein